MDLFIFSSSAAERHKFATGGWFRCLPWPRQGGSELAGVHFHLQDRWGWVLLTPFPSSYRARSHLRPDIGHHSLGKACACTVAKSTHKASSFASFVLLALTGAPYVTMSFQSKAHALLLVVIWSSYKKINLWHRLVNMLLLLRHLSEVPASVMAIQVFDHQQIQQRIWITVSWCRWSRPPWRE